MIIAKHRYNNKSNYLNLTAIQANAFGIVLDTSALPIGYFPFNVTIPGAQSVTVNSLFTVTHGALVFPGKNDIPNSPIVKNPSYQYAYDNWNNQLYQINTLNNKTAYINNIDNKTTQVTQPAVDVLNEDGTTNTNINPITITGFDIRSNRIGVIRPNGNAVNNPVNNTEGFQLDEAAQLVADILADGTYADRNVFDTLGRITTRITKVDSNNNQYVLVYDHRNNVIQETYPTGSIWRYAYNEINRRYLQTDPSPESIYYDYDFNANISANYLPGGEVTTMDYERNHKTIKIKYPTVDNNDNMSQFWYLDYFGDAVLEYNQTTFNNNGWITETTQSYSTDSNTNTTFDTFYPDGQPSNQTTNYVQSGITDTLNDIQFALFDDFQLMSMGGSRRLANGDSSNYSSTQKYYDSNGIVSAQSGINCAQGYNPDNYLLGTSVLITSYDGFILSRYELLGVNSDAPLLHITLPNLFMIILIMQWPFIRFITPVWK